MFCVAELTHIISLFKYDNVANLARSSIKKLFTIDAIILQLKLLVEFFIGEGKFFSILLNSGKISPNCKKKSGEKISYIKYPQD